MIKPYTNKNKRQHGSKSTNHNPPVMPFQTFEIYLCFLGDSTRSFTVAEREKKTLTNRVLKQLQRRSNLLWNRYMIITRSAVYNVWKRCMSIVASTTLKHKVHERWRKWLKRQNVHLYKRCMKTNGNLKSVNSLEEIQLDKIHPIAPEVWDCELKSVKDLKCVKAYYHVQRFENKL